MKSHDDVFYLIKHLSKCLEIELDKETAKSGLTPQQGRILRLVVKKEREQIPVRQTDIEKIFSLSKSTVSGLVKRLEAKSLIYKEKKDSNVFILPKDEAIKIVDEIVEKKIEINKRITANLDPQEIDETIKILNKLLENIEKGVN